MGKLIVKGYLSCEEKRVVEYVLGVKFVES